MFLASLPPGFPQSPNVLLIRTHPNPFPSVGYNNIIKTIFLQTIIQQYLLMVLTHNLICQSSDLVFKRQTDNAVSKANR
jgi:hypothetical protein